MQDLENNIKGCDIFGISSTSYNWYVSRELIEKINQINPNIRIVLGGVHPTFYNEYCLKSTKAHIVIKYEGEITLPLVINAIAKKKSFFDIEGISYKTDKGKIVSNPNRNMLTEDQLGKMPLPAYHLIPPNKYGYIPFETSRGCHYNCTFCGIFFHHSHRTLLKERISATINQLKPLNDRFTDSGLFFYRRFFRGFGKT